MQTSVGLPRARFWGRTTYFTADQLILSDMELSPIYVYTGHTQWGQRTLRRNILFRSTFHFYREFDQFFQFVKAPKFSRWRHSVVMRPETLAIDS